MNKLRSAISIAMCTYNGAQYIEEQLTSILHQTRKVDEIVICDDGSLDNTLEIIGRIKRETTTTMRIVRNKVRLGFYKNFLKALSLCDGDLVFLSDQDDIWCKDKVEKMVAYFERYTSIDVLFTNAKLIDENSEVFINETLWDRAGFTPKMQLYFEKGYGQEIWTISNRATGATMAVRKSFFLGEDWQKYNLPLHDYIISFVAVIEGHCGYISEPLMSYRIHKGQTIGAMHYVPCFYPPLLAYTADLDGICNLPASVNIRLEFMRKRESLYKRFLGAFLVCCYVSSYIRIYGKWWYKFVGYDIFWCMKKTLLIICKQLRKIVC